MAMNRIKREQNKYATFLLTPALAVIIIFTSIPAITTLSYAFFRWKGFQRQEFAGLENFHRLVNDPFKSYFYMALRHNVLVFIAILLIQTSMGILIGYALFKLHRGQRYFRTVVFLPVIFSLVIVAYMWQALLDPFYGPINFLLKAIHLKSLAKTWLGSTSSALPTLVFINLWRWVGFPAIIFLAGFNAINTEYIEAARIDGASEGKIFRKILIPLLAPSMTIVTILT